jgi:hypothetical protein
MGSPSGDTSQGTVKKKWRREFPWNCLGNNISQWFSWPMPILMPMFLALLFLSSSFVWYYMSATANQKFNQLYLQGYQPLQNHLEKLLWRPHPGCHRSLRILPYTEPLANRQQLRDWCFTPIPNPQPLPSSWLKKKWGNDRTIMLLFISWWPFYPQASLEKLPRTAPPLNKFLRL